MQSMTKERYRAVPAEWDVRELTEDVTFANGEQVEAWLILDTVEDVYVDRWGNADPDYWAAHRDVAEMRARDLNMVR